MLLTILICDAVIDVVCCNYAIIKILCFNIVNLMFVILKIIMFPHMISVVMIIKINIMLCNLTNIMD